MGYDGEFVVWENRHVRSAQVGLGEVVYEAGGQCGPRNQRDFQLVFLHSGEINVAVDTRQHQLRPGHVGLFLPGGGEHFSFSTTHTTHHSWCSVAPAYVPAELRKQLENAPHSQVCNDLLRRLLAAGLALDESASELGHSVVDHIGLALLTGYAMVTDVGVEDAVVAKAIRYLQQHLLEADCLQQAHVAAGVSRNTLISRFRRQLKTTPARYVWRSRTERGIAMLTETGRTIAEIAYACGFRDPFHFSRLVKALQGVSPQSLRQRNWPLARDDITQ